MFIKILLLWMLVILCIWMGNNMLSTSKTQQKKIRY